MVVVALASTACPDPCVLSGHACNITSDCPHGQVCDLIGAFDVTSCPVVGGLCTDDACGSDADCALGCCNLLEHKCTQDLSQCARAECKADAACAGGEKCNDGRCRVVCEQDLDCPGDERCFAGTCSDALGDACILRDGGACGGDSGSCVDVDINDVRVTPYCTGRCESFPVDGEKTDCPAGFVCDTVSFQCRRT